MATLPQYGLLALVLYTLWSVCRRLFLSKSVINNVRGPRSHSLLSGNLAAFHDPDGWDFQQDIEQNYGQVVKIHGFLGKPNLFVFDPVALHSILIQEADIYEEDLTYTRVYKLLWGPGILSSIGENHRRYRKIMTPAFSTGRLREMIPIFYEVAEKARDGLMLPFLVDGPKKLDIHDILGRTSLEVVGQAGVGYSFDPMIPGEDLSNQYAETLKGIFLIKAKKEAVSRGELDVKDDPKDIMSLLLRGNLEAEEGMPLNDDELIAQTVMMVEAATDTTSSALTQMFHILSQRPDIQEKLRAEIVEAPEHMDYDELGSLAGLDAFVHEVLRLYPPVTPAMFRVTLQDTILPLSKPLIGIDGTEITSIPIPKGTTLYIAIAAVNHSKEIWGDDALEFRPERWANGTAGGASERICGVYGNMMTFLGGGRSCIGFQFSLYEIKVILSVFLRSFQFSGADVEVKWKMPGIVTFPTVDGKVELPMMVQNMKSI
ncbi:cytochrome P450 [Mycena galopus ATCC 62051]|nr:cytochrome P450 [Mycena galopus ATCC 62051]